VTVRRGAIENTYPKDKVQLVAASKDEVYQQILTKVPPGDAAARMKLAKWMLFAGMREQARREALEVVKLQPTNTAAAEMARSLEESLRRFPENGKLAAEAPPDAAPKCPNPGVHTPGSPPPTIPPAVIDPEPAVTPDAAAAFPAKVQPILANLCAECHAKPGYGGPFKLATSSGFEDRPQVTAQNLKAVAAQLRKGDPAASPLLLKAVAAHGGVKQSAFHGKPAAYATLEAWVYVAAGPVANPAATVTPIPPAAAGTPGPPLPAAPPPAASVPGAPATTTPPLPVVPPPLGLPPGGGPLPTPELDRPKFGQDIKPTSPSGPDPANVGEPVDEFDPSVFNRTVHPMGR
jgi:hypothetical protein